MEVDTTDLAVFGVLLLAAFGAYVFFNGPISQSPSLTPVPAGMPSDSAALSVVLSPCLGSADADTCAGTAAYAASDLSACATWAQPDACRYFYFSQRAEREKDTLTVQDGTSDCLSINNTAVRSSCLQEYAVRTGKPEYCLALEYGMFRQACLDEVSSS